MIIEVDPEDPLAELVKSSLKKAAIEDPPENYFCACFGSTHTTILNLKGNLSDQYIAPGVKLDTEGIIIYILHHSKRSSIVRPVNPYNTNNGFR